MRFQNDFNRSKISNFDLKSPEKFCNCVRDSRLEKTSVGTSDETKEEITHELSISTPTSTSPEKF